MEVFFNELSVRIAVDDNEAKRWLTDLANVGRLLKQIIESMQEDSFAFRRKEDFGEMRITAASTVRQFLEENFEFSDPEPIFLLGIFDSPYIAMDDPTRSDYEYISLRLDDAGYNESGLAAAFLKKTLAVSFDSDTRWDTCDFEVGIERLNSDTMQVEEIREIVRHASKEQHIIQCHLLFLSELFDWASYRPRFTAEVQTILPMLEIYSLILGTGSWSEFYHEISTMQEGERVAKINALATRIAQLQRWEKAIGNLASLNKSRNIYTIPNSNLIIGLDTQHGEFEVHTNQKGNNHLGSLSFDGKRFKPARSDRSVNL
jgi:hypothetical protein